MLDFLKTMPDMTTQEITMIETPKKPMTKRIRAYKAEHPNATHREIAKALGTTSKYVSLTLTTLAKPKVKDQASETSISKREFDRISDENDLKQMMIEGQAQRILELNVIIEYLEKKVDELNEIKYT